MERIKIYPIRNFPLQNGTKMDSKKSAGSEVSNGVDKKRKYGGEKNRNNLQKTGRGRH